MKVFTYADFCVYKKNETEINEALELFYDDNDSSLCLREDDEPYEIAEHLPTVNNEHDKIFRKILDNKKEAAMFINKNLNLARKLCTEDLEKYNSSFITKNLKNQESDIVYKLKDKNIFFLIEHQTKIDYSMPFRILQYEIEIIKSAINYRKLGKKDYKYPNIIPIVLYTGKKKWNSQTYLRKVQEQLIGYDTLELAKYNLVDINNFSEEDLLEENNFLSKVMLIEKVRHTDELMTYLPQIAQKVSSNKIDYTKEQIDLLTTIIEVILRTKLDDHLREELIQKINQKEGKDMLAIVETLREENKRLLARGEKKGKKETAKKLLEKGISLEIIMEATGLKEKEILGNIKK